MYLFIDYLWWHQQMLYYVKDPGATTSFYRGLLSNRGKLLIILESGKWEAESALLSQLNLIPIVSLLKTELYYSGHF